MENGRGFTTKGTKDAKEEEKVLKHNSGVLFDEGGEVAEARVGGVAEDAVKDGLGRQEAGAGGFELAPDGREVLGAAAAGGVGEDGDLEIGGEGVEDGEVNADGDFEAGDEEVGGGVLAEPFAEAVGGEGGEAGLGEGRGAGAGGFAEERGGRAELGGGLFGQGGGNVEEAGGSGGEGAAPGEVVAAGGQGAEEGVLDIHEEESEAGRSHEKFKIQN